MKLKKIVATTTIAGALSFGALGVGGIGVANADRGMPVPTKPGQCGRDFDCSPGPGPNGNWNNNLGGNWNRGNDNWNRGNDNWNNGDFSVGSRDWWRGRPDKRWGDGDLPPWGFWGQPPAYQWSGPPPWVDAHPINYWGYWATPVWDDGFHGWGIWLFGIWIPIVGVQTF